MHPKLICTCTINLGLFTLALSAIKSSSSIALWRLPKILETCIISSKVTAILLNRWILPKKNQLSFRFVFWRSNLVSRCVIVSALGVTKGWIWWHPCVTTVSVQCVTVSALHVIRGFVQGDSCVIVSVLHVSQKGGSDGIHVSLCKYNVSLCHQRVDPGWFIFHCVSNMCVTKDWFDLIVPCVSVSLKGCARVTKVSLCQYSVSPSVGTVCHCVRTVCHQRVVPGWSICHQVSAPRRLVSHAARSTRGQSHWIQAPGWTSSVAKRTVQSRVGQIVFKPSTKKNIIRYKKMLNLYTLEKIYKI